MKKEFTLNRLSDIFYSDYNEKEYPEMERKESRPYMVMVVNIDGNRFALPLRTNIQHNYCYKFKNTGRQTHFATGIDFTKAVIVNDEKYIGESAVIDNKEYIELDKRYHFIINKFTGYLKGYISFVKDGADEFVAKRYKFTTLKYFHKELGF